MNSIWFIPAVLALVGLFLALFHRDYDLARRSAAVLMVSFGLAQVSLAPRVTSTK